MHRSPPTLAPRLTQQQTLQQRRMWLQERGKRERRRLMVMTMGRRRQRWKAARPPLRMVMKTIILPRCTLRPPLHQLFLCHWRGG